ncbi:MAG TPA: hypothetical protein VJX16_27710 [Terriglobales bacterium]|nr:hypothetical protein [Terriglobales bacterium]
MMSRSVSGWQFLAGAATLSLASAFPPRTPASSRSANPSFDTDFTVDCELLRGQPASAVDQILDDSDVNACNRFDQPDRVVPHPAFVSPDGTRSRVERPHLSVTAITVRLRR